MSARYCQRTCTDFTVYVECTRFDVHKAVLSCHSGYFANIFKQQSRESNCDMKLDNSFGISATTFRVILDYMYSGGKCELALIPLYIAISLLLTQQIDNLASSFYGRIIYDNKWKW